MLYWGFHRDFKKFSKLEVFEVLNIAVLQGSFRETYNLPEVLF